MNKDKLQQEILAKIKPGTKPSDLKRPRKVIKPKSLKDDGYQSDSSDKIPTAPPLPNQTIKDLQSQITALQKQLQLYKDFRESDLKIKEQLKQELAAKDKTIETIKSQAKSITNTKQQSNEPQETKTFTCSECQQTKPETELSRIFGKFSFCLNCSKKARQTASQQKTKPQPVDFICHLCEQSKQEIPHQIKLDKTLTEYNICSTCKPTAKEFNEADLITDDL
jgi:hypothetical protein